MKSNFSEKVLRVSKTKKKRFHQKYKYYQKESTSFKCYDMKKRLVRKKKQILVKPIPTFATLEIYNKYCMIVK